MVIIRIPCCIAFDARSVKTVVVAFPDETDIAPKMKQGYMHLMQGYMHYSE